MLQQRLLMDDQHLSANREAMTPRALDARADDGDGERTSKPSPKLGAAKRSVPGLCLRAGRASRVAALPAVVVVVVLSRQYTDETHCIAAVIT
jgi:hypothetical protein